LNELPSKLSWQGIGCRLPPDWNLLEYSGSRRKGGLRVGDLRQTKLEMIWQTPGRFANLERAWSRYQKQLTPRRSKSKPVFESRPRIARRFGEHGWRDPVAVELAVEGSKSIHVLAGAPFSKRYLLLRFPVGPEKSEIRDVDTVVSSVVECDPSKSEEWSAYGFTMRAPRSAQLGDVNLRPGHLVFGFRRRGLQIRWERLAFAEQTLAGKDLAEWMQSRMKTARERARWVEGEPISREGCLLWRTPSFWGRGVPRRLRQARRITAWRVHEVDQLVVLRVAGSFNDVGSEHEALCEGWQVEAI
jgi:hypothetical protein